MFSMLSILYSPSIVLNSTAPSHCSSPGTHSQPTTENTDITATVGAGIQFLVMTSQHWTIYFHDDVFWFPDTLPHLPEQNLCKQHDHLIHLYIAHGSIYATCSYSFGMQLFTNNFCTACVYQHYFISPKMHIMRKMCVLIL